MLPVLLTAMNWKLTGVIIQVPYYKGVTDNKQAWDILVRL